MSLFLFTYVYVGLESLNEVASTMFIKKLAVLLLGTEFEYLFHVCCNVMLVFQFISVLNDIASTMFNKKFIHEIFLKHTPLYSKKVLRAMFDRLAHASIMRLNAGSMDKVRKIISQLVK